MVKRFINTIISKLFIQDLPTQDNAFIVQKQLLKRLLSSYNNSPLYKNIWLKQDETFDLLYANEQLLKRYISQFEFIEYKTHILPLLDAHKWIAYEDYDFLIRTSWTSDSNQWWKLIPTHRWSLNGDRVGMKRTIAYYLAENPLSNLFFKKAFMLTASFNKTTCIWYISGIMRYTNMMYKYAMFPPDDILYISDWSLKKQKIIDFLLEQTIQICSFHGVPTRSLDIIHELIKKDITNAKRILQSVEYVSIGWWPALNYKQQFQDILRSLWLSQKVYGSNNHNSSEWFLWSQVRYFDDLNYHRMSPVMQTNFFLFISVDVFDEYRNALISYQEMIMQSFLLHEVEFEKEYLMLFANDRIPWLYNIKDKVIFRDNTHEWWNVLLEYLVTWRYGMASNLFNEHIELPHLLYVFDKLTDEWYQFDKNNFVAGMQLVDNTWIFHIVVESMIAYDVPTIMSLIDVYLWEVNDQWKSFRDRNKIIDIKIIIVQKNYIRDNLIELGKMHEQSKIPHLSDYNYINIIEPLLQQIKK